MNYDLCDLLNRKLEASCSYFPENGFNKSISKNQDLLDIMLEKIAPEEYLEIMESQETEHLNYNCWVYRNGKFSNQVAEFDQSAKKITRELANLSFSNNPALDIMYFSGIMKLIFAYQKAIYVECCIRPSLDQMLYLKDLERNILSKNGVLIWRIVERRGKNNFDEGIGLNNLHAFKWSRIK